MKKAFNEIFLLKARAALFAFLKLVQKLDVFICNVISGLFSLERKHLQYLSFKKLLTVSIYFYSPQM